MSDGILTPTQAQLVERLEDELRVKRGSLPVVGKKERYGFTMVNGVTVLIKRTSRQPRGGFIVPSLYSYTEIGSISNLDAAAHANELFDRQDPVRVGRYGHRGPIIGLDWKCGKDCCRDEPYKRRVERSLGFVPSQLDGELAKTGE
jgi:hypothetical protein